MEEKHKQAFSHTKWLCFALGLLVWGGAAAESWAQMPLTQAQRRKRAKMMREARCIKRCQDVAFKRFYRCAKKSAIECNIRGWLAFRGCIRRCQAPWFCKGFKTSVGAHCGKMCLREQRRKRKRFCARRKETRRAKRMCVRRYLRWRGRTRHACKHVCKTLILECSIKIPNKLPPPTRLPNFKRL